MTQISLFHLLENRPLYLSVVQSLLNLVSSLYQLVFPLFNAFSVFPCCESCIQVPLSFLISTSSCSSSSLRCLYHIRATTWGAWPILTAWALSAALRRQPCAAPALGKQNNDVVVRREEGGIERVRALDLTWLDSTRAQGMRLGVEKKSKRCAVKS